MMSPEIDQIRTALIGQLTDILDHLDPNTIDDHHYGDEPGQTSGGWKLTSSDDALKLNIDNSCGYWCGELMHVYLYGNFSVQPWYWTTDGYDGYQFNEADDLHLIDPDERRKSWTREEYLSLFDNPDVKWLILQIAQFTYNNTKEPHTNH